MIDHGRQGQREIFFPRISSHWSHSFCPLGLVASCSMQKAPEKSPRDRERWTFGLKMSTGPLDQLVQVAHAIYYLRLPLVCLLPKTRTFVIE